MQPRRRARLRIVPAALLAVGLACVLPARIEAGEHAPRAANAACGDAVLGIAQGFNVFVQHTYGASNTSVEGRVAAGGDATIDSYSVGSRLAPSAARTDLIAGGSLTVGGGGAQAPNGSVTYGTTLSGSISTPNGTLQHAPAPFDVDAQFASLSATSTDIYALGGAPGGGPSYAFDFTGTSTTTNVFKVDATVLQTAQVVRFKVPFGSSTIVNVTGDRYSSATLPTTSIEFWDGSNYVRVDDSSSPDVLALRNALLWNFPTASSVQIGPNMAWQGTVLAPRAALTFPGSTQLNGTIIAASLENSSGAARNAPYSGCLPPPPPVAADDHYQIDAGSTLHVDAPGVLGNDTVTSGATAALVHGVQHGTLSLAANGSFAYTPGDGFTGTDSFTYNAVQGGATSNTATVTIDVTPSTTRLLTVAARVCPSYDDVTANLARNNIQESLRPLGADSAYTSGQPIDPDIEAAHQPNCKPVEGWTFTLGTGIESRAVSGSWGSLSIVTNPFATAIETQPTTDLLNDRGQPTGRQIAGAETITLDPDQAELATQASSLWIQAGTPEDPILDETYPGQYGFAALRCGIDDLNGDNVEWIAYPTGATHVFCFAYYIKPPPTSGTIVVRKEVTGSTATQTFPFKGNISFTPDQSFSLDVENGKPAAMTFYRAETKPGEAPWSFAESVPPDWRLTSITCDSATGGSTTHTDLASAAASVKLAPGDVVTCTYTDAPIPLGLGTLTIAKTTQAGIGKFGYTITSAAGGSATTASATTTRPGTEVLASPSLITLEPGRYEIAESLPTASRGHWRLTGVECNGVELPAASPVSVTITASSGTLCSFTNRFFPIGNIEVFKRTLGGVGTVGFLITPRPPLAYTEYSKFAVVEAAGALVRASGDSTSNLPLGTYTIQEFAPPSESPTGWALTSVVCNGQLVGSSQGAVQVRLTSRRPGIRCDFTNTHTAAPIPLPRPPEPGPTPPPNPDPVPVAHIELTKTEDRRVVEVGGIVTYTVTVRNTGDIAAQGQVITEETPVTNSTVVSMTPSQGTCQFSHAPASCILGTIDAGGSATVVVKLRATHPGLMPNNVAVNSQTIVPNPPTSGVKATAIIRKRPRPAPGGAHTPPPFTG